MSGSRHNLSDSRLAYRVATSPLIGYPLLLCWNKGWLRQPHSRSTALLRDGRILNCDLADETQRTMYLGLFEPAETQLISKLLKPGDTFIDVGAHIGWYTTVASRCVGETGQVIAVEPYPQNVVALRENLEQNGSGNVRVAETALGSKLGTLTLSQGKSSGGVTALEWADRQGLVEVPMSTLDDIATNIEVVTLIKIDVEGWEAHVLQGAASTMLRTKHVLIEFAPASMAKAGTSAEQISDQLRSAGFTTFKPVTQVGLRRFHRNPVINVLATR